jgi:RNA polymerase sigma factor (sigma-70 family)
VKLEKITAAALVTAAKKGDKEAFGTLIESYQSAAWHFAVHLAGDEDWGREALQEATLQAYLSLDHLRNPPHFKSWFFSIILNVYRSKLRERRKFTSLVNDADFQVQAVSATDNASIAAEQEELRASLLEALDRLHADYRQVLQLFYFRGFGITEIASAIAISESAVKVRLHRARLKLKAILKSEYPDIYPGRRKQMIPVTIADVKKQERKDAEGSTYPLYVVLLLDKAGGKVLPIWIGATEGQSIAAGIQGLTAPRPLTYDFLAGLLEATGAKVEEVRVETLKDTTYYAVVKVTHGRTSKEIDARPSDALALAVRIGSPIFVAEDVLEKAGISLGTREAPNLAGVTAINKEVHDFIWKAFAKPAVPKENFDALKKLLDDI